MSEDLMQMADPLAALGEVDLTKVDTSRPLLEAGLHRVRITEIESKESATTPGNMNMVVQFETVDPIGAHDSEQVLPAGWKIRKYFPLQHSAKGLEEIAEGKEPSWNYLTQICEFADAVTGNEDQATRPNFDFPSYINQEIMLRIVVAEQKQDGQKTGVFDNEIKGYQHPVE